MTDGLRHLDAALELGRQLGRGETVRLTKECPHCHGSRKRSDWVNELGREVESPCPDCKGTGRVPA